MVNYVTNSPLIDMPIHTLYNYHHYFAFVGPEQRFVLFNINNQVQQQNFEKQFIGFGGCYFFGCCCCLFVLLLLFCLVLFCFLRGVLFQSYRRNLKMDTICTLFIPGQT